MKKKEKVIWYCENSKGEKIAPYGDNYHVPGPEKRWSFERVLNIIGIVLGLSLISFILFSISQLVS